MIENERNRKRSVDSPLIYHKDVKAIVEQIRELAPFYTPEWRFSEQNPDPGSTLALIVADMLQENIKRLNRVPLKNYIAYLNLLNSQLLPARAASAYVKFEAVNGVKHPVYVPAGTQLVAQTDRGNVLFETQSPLTVTPAHLVETYQVDPYSDTIIQGRNMDQNANSLNRSPSLEDSGEQTIHAEAEKATGGEIVSKESDLEALFPLKLFDFNQGINGQEHALYLGHEDLFNIKETVWIELSLFNSTKAYIEREMCQCLTDPEVVEWMYATEQGWVKFAEATATENNILLKKNEQGQINSCEINRKNSRWIKCKVKSIAMLDERLIELSDIRMRASYADFDKQGGFLPDQLFQDDMELDVAGFYPFGKVFAPYSIFYIACAEAFSKRESTITITFNLKFLQNRLYPEMTPYIEWKLLMKKSAFHRPQFPPITISNVLWEYWNGRAWVKLAVSEGSDRIFHGSSEGERKVTFRCPADLQKSHVNSLEQYWIRVRVVDVDHLYSGDPVYLSPWLENFRLSYGYPDHNLPVEVCVTKNNLEYQDHSPSLQNSGSLLRPFHRIDSSYPAFYMGFDQAPGKGPISMYFSIQSRKYKADEIPYIMWEYLASNGNQSCWKALKAIDDTNHFTRSGTVQFAGSEDFMQRILFGKSLFWIRAVNMKEASQDASGKTSGFPQINRVYMNCSRVVQQEEVKWEIPMKLEGEVEHEYQLAGRNVLNEQVWVDETSRLGRAEVNELMRTDPDCVELVEDSEGNIQKVWVRWSPTGHALESKATDRHYMINHNSGKIRFGDGKYGRVPPITSEEQLKVSYKTVKGKVGNVDAFQISKLQSSIPFIQAVYNPDPASGGCDAERIEDALRRAPQKLRHRERAVTAEDFEYLVKEGFPLVVKVKCLPNYNVYMEKESGSLTIIALQQGGRKDSGTFSEYKRQIEQLLLDKTANIIAFSKNIYVIEPAFLEVSVHVELVINSVYDQIIIEREANKRLNEFLHPVTGHYDRNGWDIGESIHPSMFYSLLASINGVHSIEKCSITIFKEEDGERTELLAEEADKLPHGVICNGKHSITIKFH